MDGGQRGPVVVGIDGMAEARHTLNYAAWEAQRRRTTLRLVHGFAPVPAYGPSIDSGHSIETILTGIRQRLRRAAADVRERYPSLTVEVSVVAGAPAGVLIEESRAASLVVVGSRPAPGLFGMLTGSVSGQVAAHAHAPVIVLRPTTDPDNGRPTAEPVVVGVDTTPAATAALRFAFDEAAARGGELVAVHAEPPATPHRTRHAPVDPDQVLSAALADWTSTFPQVPVRSQAVSDASVVHALLESGDRAALIVVGAHHHAGLRGLLPGFIGDGLVRHARRPVAVVPLPRDEPTPVH